MKEFKKALNYGHFHKNSKEFPEFTTENFTSTIYPNGLRNYEVLILTKKKTVRHINTDSKINRNSFMCSHNITLLVYTIFDPGISSLF
jgi:hypothetical protein